MTGRALASAAGAVGVLLGSCAVPAPSVNGDESGAEYTCEEFVKDRLKSPASAEFSDESATSDGKLWTVMGSVDSQNSFGAPIRNKYICVVRHKGGEGDVYSLVSLTGLEN